MPTLAAGSPRRDHQRAGSTRSRGFTLLELLVVMAIVAMASAGVVLALRERGASDLERDAQRLAAVLESGRAKSRMQGTPVLWRAVPGGFVLDGLSPPMPAQLWLNADTTVDAVLHGALRGTRGSAIDRLVLGPEPIVEAQALVLASRSKPELRLQLATDGLRPFGIVPVGTALGANPESTPP